MKAKVHVTLKPGVLDPQGRAVLHALEALGFGGVDGVRQGKYIEIDLAEGDRAAAKLSHSLVERETERDMCKKLLANTVIEDYRVDISEG